MLFQGENEVRQKKWGPTGPPPPMVDCYVWNFDTLTPSDQITLLTYNGNVEVITLNIDVNLTAAQIKTAIEAGLDGEPIFYTSVTVVKTSIGGGLFHFKITIKNPSVIFSFFFLTGGTFYAPVVNDCPDSDTFILDNNNITIDDNNDLPLVSK